MPITAIAQLKAWYVTRAKPLQEQFWAWLDSYWHKSELIPMASVDGLVDYLNAIGYSIRGSYAGGDDLAITMQVGALIKTVVIFGAPGVAVTIDTSTFSDEVDDEYSFEIGASGRREHTMDRYLAKDESLIISGGACDYIIFISK